ncbi:MAG: GGDEF domain-containing protein [Shinella sp.]|nr:GGDEF domain-containing protein [Shinella sp.]
MILDLRTIYVVSAMTCLILGMIQLAAYSTGRFERWPLWWGMSNILIGIGSFCIGLRDIAPDVVSVDIGNVVQLAGYILMVAAMRVFAGRRVDMRICLLAMLLASVPILFMSSPLASLGRIAFGSALCCACDLVIMREGLRLARREKLYSAWFLVALYVPTSLIFAVRGLLAATGHLGAPQLFSGGNNGAHVWLAMMAVVFITLRSVVIVLLAAERSQRKLSELAHHDPLTGALNRSGLAKSFAAAGNGPLSLLIVDIDHFKALNDTHGHAAGDDMLRLFASIAGGQLRTGDLLARQGGDEFVVVLKDASVEDAVRIAERIREAFTRAATDMQGLSVFPTLSIGVARRAAMAADLESLLQKADEALYRSKREGRNRVETFDEGRRAA